jgi:ribosomal-protein-alanine N-acetyltransferase
MAPVIETERLRLAPLAPEDLDRHHAALGSDPAVPWTRRARSYEESADVVRRRVSHWEEHGFGFWAVTRLDTGEFLGEAGLQRFDGTDQVEVGYYLGRAAWGGGIATEAGAAAVRHGFEALGLDRLVAVVRPDNEGSKRVLAKLGLRFVAVEDHYGVPDAELWALDRAAWAAGRAA